MAITIFGVTEQGFEVKRFTDITDRIYNDLKDNIHPLLDVSTGSVVNQLVEPFAHELEEVWAELHSTWLSRSPNDAEGLSLDHVIAYIGLQRLGAVVTRVQCAVQSTVGTVMTTALQILTLQNKVMRLSADFTSTQNNVLSAYFAVDFTALAGQVYNLTVNGILVTYTDTAPIDVQNVVANLINNIESAVPEISASSFPSATNFIYILGASGQVIADFDGGVKVDWYNALWFEALIPEKYVITALSIDSVITPISGLGVVQNPDSGQTGRDKEQDSEARIRFKASFQILGAATLGAIIARIAEVDDVSQVQGYENVTDFIDVEGRPPHSIEIVVVGGSNQDIGELLFLVKAGGIKTHGNTGVNVIDSNGDLQIVNFTRPTILFGYVEVTITKDTETPYPLNGDDQVILAVLAYGDDNLNVGVDLVGQRFVGPVHEISGIRNVSVRVAATLTTTPTPPWASEQIITADEVVVLDGTRITIISI